jgi:hypothetical protein
MTAMPSLVSTMSETTCLLCHIKEIRLERSNGGLKWYSSLAGVTKNSEGQYYIRSTAPGDRLAIHTGYWIS